MIFLCVFLEHMLFYASAKYPEEDSYSKYITEVIYTYIYSGEFVLVFVCSLSLEFIWCSMEGAQTRIRPLKRRTTILISMLIVSVRLWTGILVVFSSSFYCLTNVSKFLT